MSAPGALKTEREILSRFQELRSELDNLAARANNIAAELNEHDLVLKTLEPLDGGRKCYRLVHATCLLYTHPVQRPHTAQTSHTSCWVVVICKK